MYNNTLNGWNAFAIFMNFEAILKCYPTEIYFKLAMYS